MTIQDNRGWAHLPQISKTMYKATYFLDGEDYDGWVARMANTYSNDAKHADQITTMLNNFWFHPSTPVSGNGGTTKGLPISCYVGDVEDSKEGIFNSWTESGWLGSQAGGIGRTWSAVREIGSPVGQSGGVSSGIIPFMCVDGALTRAVSQGSLRRMSQADYLDISHPEIEEFIEIRKPTGDQNRRDQDLHHGVCIPDAFMQALINNKKWDLVSPKTGDVIKSVSAQHLWTKILELRATTGEPYMFFYDNVNNQAPKEYKELGLDIHLSNLCSEILLNTSPTKTNVCCLASLNLEYYDEYRDILPEVVGAATDFLDNVLQEFIDKTKDRPGFENARNAAIHERAIGLGVMGFHSLLQKKHIPFESAIAKGLNNQIFSSIRAAADAHQDNLPDEATCPMALEAGTKRRNIVTLAIAPTMSISSLCNLASSGIEPWVSNAFTKKLKQGSFAIRNKHLDAKLREILDTDRQVEEAWASIKKAEGSVQHLDCIDDYTKDVYKTAFELDQKWLIEHAADRTPYVDQGQSLNLFIPGNSHVQYISDLHVLIWKKGVKTAYYLRSTNPNRASTSSTERQTIKTNEPDLFSDACVGCA